MTREPRHVAIAEPRDIMDYAIFVFTAGAIGVLLWSLTPWFPWP